MKRLKTIILLLFVVLFAGSSVVLSGLWKDKKYVKSVEFNGATTLFKDEVFDFAKLNDSLILSNSLTLEQIETRIAKHPNIKSVHVTRENGVINIEISEKDPFALVTNGKKMYLIDDRLNLYNLKKENRDIDLPVISGLSEVLDINNYSKDDMKDLKIAQYLIKQILKTDKILYNYISEINFSDSTGIKLYSSEDATPVYFLDYDEVNQKSKLPVDVRNLDITNNDFRDLLKMKIVYLDDLLKQVIVYKGRYSLAYIDMRYRDMVLLKNNNIQTNE
ncbi:MAG: cell division protein FtsQ/DivIB [Ignavibacteria bacterium]